ncbi:MAG: succinyl-diaminopimelate desuccinylase [Candidatus Oxydemutatoraceae bacterium WSBS_2016_MAG_OTU14]
MLSELLKELVQRRSVTPDDAGCQDFIAEKLSPYGFIAETLPCGPVSNLWLRRGQTSPLFVFAGHTDVVPPGDETAWNLAPFAATIKDGFLYGRGAADMKGGVAAMTHACQTFIEKYPAHQGSIALLLTSDEEGPAIEGTRYVVQKLKERGVTFDWCIVGEPSSHQQLGDVIRYGRRGSLTGKMQVIGKQGHVAYPDTINNPISAVGTILTALSQFEWDKGNAHFPPTSFQWYRINADAHASNIVPGTLSVEFNLRFSPESSPASIKKNVEDLCKQNKLNAKISWHLSAEPFLTEPGTLIQEAQRAIKAVTGVTTNLSTGGGTSDGRYIVDICPQLIELGPINETIHQVNEHVNLEDLHHLSQIYQKILERLLLKS